MSIPIPKPEAELCVNCGAEVRPNTQFCYACGRSVTDLQTAPPPEAANESLSDLEKALAESRISEVPKSRIESAAAERRKARVSSRKPVEIVWEPTGTSLGYFIAAILIFIIAILAVILSRN